MHALTTRTVYREQRITRARGREGVRGGARRRENEEEEEGERGGEQDRSRLARSCEGHPRAETPRADVTTSAVTSPPCNGGGRSRTEGGRAREVSFTTI